MCIRDRLHAKPSIESFVTVALFSWPIYAIIRVIGYVCLGAALTWFSYTLITNFLLKKLMKSKLGPFYFLAEKFIKIKIIDIAPVKNILIIAAITIILDFILKATIANMVYQPILNAHTILP